MYIISKEKHIIFFFLQYRKLKPPIPTIKNRVLQHFVQPRVFEDNSDFILKSIEKPDKHFDGWSFIQTEDHKDN
jgi:hypothetical protein